MMDESDPPSVVGKEGRVVEGGGKKGDCSSDESCGGGVGIVDDCPFYGEARERVGLWRRETVVSEGV